MTDRWAAYTGVWETYRGLVCVHDVPMISVPGGPSTWCRDCFKAGFHEIKGEPCPS